MKFPSLQSLYSGFLRVLKRFPLEIAFALAGTIAATVNIELNSLQREAENWCIRIMMAANLGLLLALSATLFSERKNYGFLRKSGIRCLAILTALLFLLLLNPQKRETDYLRFLLLSAGFHLLVSFIAFIGQYRINAFWQFNKTLFLRFLTGALYSAVLFLGLSAAIGSMNLLFGFQFEWDTFSILWVWIAGIFQTLFFLAGVPDDLELLEDDQNYPKALKVFTQYVLIPLASVYVAILLAYEIKIVLQLKLPEGLVSNLILGYAVFGILSLLLVYPIRNLSENKWVKTYSKSFYILLVPLIILLVWAVVVRVKDYGITEPRYYLIILAGWLSFVTSYFLFSKRQNIVVIPVSLCLVTLISIYGPQSAFSIAGRSQVGQLKELFNKYGALEKNRLKPLIKPVDSADRARMADVIGYLIDRHGLQSLQPLVPDNLNTVADSLLKAQVKKAPAAENTNIYTIRYQQKDWVYSRLNIQDARNGTIEADRVRYVKANNYQLIATVNTEYLININCPNYKDSVQVYIANKRFKINTGEVRGEITLQFNNTIKTIKTDSLIAGIEKEIKRLQPANQAAHQLPGNALDNPFILPRKFLSQQFTFDRFSVQILWNDIRYNYSGKEPVFEYGNGVLLLKPM